MVYKRRKARVWKPGWWKMACFFSHFSKHLLSALYVPVICASWVYGSRAPGGACDTAPGREAGLWKSSWIVGASEEGRGSDMDTGNNSIDTTCTEYQHKSLQKRLRGSQGDTKQNFKQVSIRNTRNTRLGTCHSIWQSEGHRGTRRTDWLYGRSGVLVSSRAEK